jgi:hypothetical protein
MTSPVFTCIRCGGPLQKYCDAVCIPCLVQQGNEYQRTGDLKVFTRAPINEERV